MSKTTWGWIGILCGGLFALLLVALLGLGIGVFIWALVNG